MLHGVVVFDATTGALVFQRRFRRHFGLPGAERQPQLADPIGLVLQLYAFNRFCGDLPGEPQLEHFSLGGGISIFFGASKQAASLRLALFAGLEGASTLGPRLAARLVEAFAEGSAVSASQGARLLEQVLCEEVPGWLVQDLVSQLPRDPGWLAVLGSSPPVHAQPHQGKLPATATGTPREGGTTIPQPTPRPPAQPPPQQRSSLARRVVQCVVPATTAPDVAPKEPSAPGNDRPHDGGSGRLSGVGLLSWRTGGSRRPSNQQRPPTEDGAPPTVATPVEERPVYFYRCGESLPPSRGAWEAIETSLTRFGSGLIRSCPAIGATAISGHSTASGTICNDQATGAVDVVDMSLSWPLSPEVAGVVPRRAAVLLRVGSITVAVPMQALLPSEAKFGEADSHTEKSVACEYRRALDYRLCALAAYHEFLAGMPMPSSAS